MLEITEIQGNQIIVLTSAAVSGTVYFEDEADCAFFWEIAKEYLTPYAHLLDYQTSQSGWVMIVKMKSEEEIFEAYHAKREAAKKEDPKGGFKEVWRIFSDAMRVLISTYVINYNFKTERQGGLVREPYKRFVFMSLEEALEFMKKLKTEWYDQEQKNRRYRPKRRLSMLRKKMLKTSVYVGSGALDVAGNLEKMKSEFLAYGEYTGDVLRQLILTTLHHHFPPKSPPPDT